MQDDEVVKVQIFRFDPSKDVRPYYEDYEVPYKKNMRVLDVINHVVENQGHSIAYRSSCGFRRCGSCGVMVNGEAKLACWEPAMKEMIIEPLKGFPVIRDLVVDRSLFEKRLSGLKPQLIRTEPLKEGPEFITHPVMAESWELQKCIGCLCCISACPLTELAWRAFPGPAAFVELGKVMLDPRDKLDRIPIAISEDIYSCTTCKKCEEACPVELAIPELVTERIRYIINQGGLGPLPEQLAFGRSVVEMGKSIPRLETTLMEMTPAVVQVDNPRDRVAYFSGCLADLRLQNIGKATIDVLRKNRVELMIPHDQICCGSPMIRTGQVDTVRDHLVEKNIRIFEELEVKTVVSACPGCTLTWRMDYPKYSQEILGYDYREKFEVLHIQEYLERIGLKTEGMSPVNMKLTYHDSCHIIRGLSTSKAQPRRLIQQIPGVELVEMEKSDWCCGAGGGVRAGRRDLSYLIGNRKTPYVQATGAEYVAMACPFCELQFTDTVQKPGIAKVIDLMELLQSAYNGSS